MRKFISKIILFIIILICLLFLYEKALALRPNEFSYKKEYIEKIMIRSRYLLWDIRSWSKV